MSTINLAKCFQNISIRIFFVRRFFTSTFNLAKGFKNMLIRIFFVRQVFASTTNFPNVSRIY